MILIQLAKVYLISQVQIFSNGNRFEVLLEFLRSQAKSIGHHTLVFNIYLFSFSFKDFDALEDGIYSPHVSAKLKQK